MKKFTKIITLCLIGVFLLTACDQAGNTTQQQYNDQQKSSIDQAKETPKAPTINENKGDNKKVDTTLANKKGVIVVQDFGTIEVEFYPEQAPITVENFVTLAQKGFYNGLTFHRIIPGFMIQGGDPKGNGTGGAGTNIKGEFTSNGVNNTIKHTRGVISMARSSAPDSASSQFFIMHQDYPSLDGQYAAFGKVIKGLEVVDKIASVKTGANDLPEKPVVIKSITIVNK